MILKTASLVVFLKKRKKVMRRFPRYFNAGKKINKNIKYDF